MACHVLIRETLDWKHARYDDLKTPFIRQVARLWDATFSVNYVDCRARLKEIALNNHKLLSEVQVHEFERFDSRYLQPGDIILPCDDDDWFHPALG